MNRILRSLLLTAVCAAAVAPMTAAPSAGPDWNDRSATSSTPAMGYFLWDWWMDYEEEETPYGTATASVSVATEFRLEDGTVIGSDIVFWSGNASQANSNGALGSAIMTMWGGMIGTWVGWGAGSWVAGWAASQVAVGAGTGYYVLGLGALAAGPYVGALAVAGLGAV